MLLIFCATVFVKQHFFLDVVAGIGVALVSWVLVRYVFNKKSYDFLFFRHRQ